MDINAIAGRYLMSKVDFTFGPPDVGSLCSWRVGPWGGRGPDIRSDSRLISVELTITIPEVAPPKL